MHLLPLHSLLNIPSEGLTIVVDNAMSPQESVSFRLQQSRRQKRQRSRTTPADNSTEGCHWSAIPPPPLVSSEDAMSPCSVGSFLRASAFLEMRSCSHQRYSSPLPVRPPVGQQSDNGLLVNKKAATLSWPSLSNENPKQKVATVNRCSSMTLKIPVCKVSSNTLVEQSTLQSAASSCSFGSQMNFQLDAVQTATDRHVLKPTPFLQKTSPRLEFVPGLTRHELHDMTIQELIQNITKEVSHM